MDLVTYCFFWCRGAGNQRKEKDWYLLDLPPADRFRPLRRDRTSLLP